MGATHMEFGGDPNGPARGVDLKGPRGETEVDDQTACIALFELGTEDGALISGGEFYPAAVAKQEVFLVVRVPNASVVSASRSAPGGFEYPGALLGPKGEGGVIPNPGTGLAGGPKPLEFGVSVLKEPAVFMGLGAPSGHGPGSLAKWQGVSP